ncbi:nuclear transport factor 2 family protein [Amycolatopsis jejuensis]|uniref:nuclear transport factor 2 family protein n=1 Tax=Amycolatopsis jejuensis TaxID=330084 RepID=UPI0005279720|nr:nuclear transport factor 2 family protein [Amycolatopsis jejuensis]
MAPAPEEVLTLAKEWLAAGHRRDTEFIAAHSWTEDDNFVHTVASGPDSALSLGDFLQHLREYDPREVVLSNPRGFAYDDFAWVFDTPHIDLLDEGVLEARFTAVLRHVEGEWKVVHAHLSEGVAHQA